MALVRGLLLALAAPAGAGSSDVPIATFDGAAETTRPWQVVNDPVMGGASTSSFSVDGGRKLGVWTGEVKIVPFLGEPGFCNLQSPGLYKEADFPDLSSAGGLRARMRAEPGGLTSFNVMLMTRGAQHFMQQGVYVANLTALTDTMADHFVPWSAFQCTWRGSKVSWCPDLVTQLAAVSSVGLGTAFPGKAGTFHVEIESLAAGHARRASGHVDLATFDGAAPHAWRSENDPVMGGQSSSSFTERDGYGEFAGSCRLVPQLRAPGFAIALTEPPLVGHFPDVSSMAGLSLGVRVAGGNITSFKFAFCDSRINPFRCQFQSFKADFVLKPSDDFQEVFLPWGVFSDKWSAYTGEHTAENPPKADSLRSITQLQMWTEGVLGDFILHVKYIRAAPAPPGPSSGLQAPGVFFT
mmetsp:Transcript_54886/g.166781  ORF Transcript_54886/g.166781 Transcript_54886/m.166781 type:complete len:410 (-) Transcript_54886:276-1505(-)|eukprot:CAMPEP_0198560844 /NCGR_PEP_ID=MMETSP1462-20131121/94540_1 /TAXON_ID=1333877 /ORGANISM="Brandtodinium nutriculum, Strain RCC3387" /LENGTH=409 /DNA_ID=CAMNT_0044291719 /DNA_START=1 /DNA_END=1230 /DNA_ORIENTATION=+